MASNSANSIYKQMQKMANDTSVQLQKMQNQANKTTLDFNKKEAATARKFNADEAQKARDWQEKMTKTSHQMEVADLKKAGLNPVLSANGGAQSYTTSSASAQNASATAESPGNAIANVLGSQLSSMAGLKGSELGAAATRQAAATAAAAQRAAAQEAAAAQRYAADRQYDAAKYKARMDYKKEMNKPQSTFAGLVDKWLQKNGVQKSASGWIKNSSASFANKNPTKNNFKLNTLGNMQAGSFLRKMNIKNTQANRNLIAKATLFNDSSAQKRISQMRTYAYTQKSLYNYKTQNSGMRLRLRRAHQRVGY